MNLSRWSQLTPATCAKMNDRALLAWLVVAMREAADLNALRGSAVAAEFRKRFEFKEVRR